MPTKKEELKIEIAEKVQVNDSVHQIIIDDRIADASALKVIEKVSEEFKSTNWSTIFTQPINELKNEKNTGKPVKILARVATVTDQFPLQLQDKRVTAIEFSINDRDDSEIECLRCEYEGLGEKITKLFNDHGYAIFKGAVISVIDTSNAKNKGKTFSSYKLLVYDIDERVRADDLIYVQKNFPMDVNKIFQKICSKGEIFSFIKQTLVNELGIKGLRSARELDKTIDFMIYQAFSNGKDDNTSMKLHSLVIGAPGSGKKILTSIARILNPVSQEVSAVDGKVTLAGMIGNVMVRENRRVSKPGYLSLASGGVLCIQDFHEIKRNRKAVLESFAKVMEDGTAIDSTSARTEHKTLTSIHLDTNKYSQVYQANTSSSLADIDIPTNVITRFDYIVDIPADAKRQWDVVLELSKGAKILDSFEIEREINLKLRVLKRIIAHIITYTPKVELSSEIAEYKIQELEKLRAEYSPRMDNINQWQGLFTRLGISFNKYLKAITTSRFTAKVTREDVDLAITFIKPKLEYVCNIKDARITQSDVATNRQELIFNKFKGNEVHKNEVLKFLLDKGESVVLKTVERDLQDLENSGKAKKARRSHWKFK